MLPSGKMDYDTSKECVFKDTYGNEVECLLNDSVVEAVSGHGWMEWGEWTPRTKSCGSNGKKLRYRQCGSCSNPNESNFCSNPTEVINRVANSHIHCPIREQMEKETCRLAKCLPWSNGKGGSEKYVSKFGWQTYQSSVTNTQVDYEGGCINHQSAGFEKYQLTTKS